MGYEAQERIGFEVASVLDFDRLRGACQQGHAVLDQKLTLLDDVLFEPILLSKRSSVADLLELLLVFVVLYIKAPEFLV